MPVKQPPAQDSGERWAEDARLGADDAVPGVVGRGAALRTPQPPRQRQQRLLRLPGPPEKGRSPARIGSLGLPTNCSCACPVKLEIWSDFGGRMSALALGVQCACRAERVSL